MKHHTYILIAEKKVDPIRGDFGKMVPIHIPPEDFEEANTEDIINVAVKLFNE